MDYLYIMFIFCGMGLAFFENVLETLSEKVFL